MIESFARLVLLMNLASTLFMTGLIWFVQVVHYPLFASLGVDEFEVYEKRHQTLTTWVVAPAMLLELSAALLLLRFRPAGVSGGQAGLGLGLVVFSWLSTAFVQVPCHEALGRGFDPASHRRLVRTNWFRTAAWSARGFLVLWMAWEVLD